MKLKILSGAFFWLFIFLFSCSEDINFSSGVAKLAFSTDTVFCDTVFNQVRSETYAVKVYNTENNNVTIPRISLARGAQSLYRINVDGKAGVDFYDVPLRAKDSLYIFIEIAPKINAPSAIAEDDILFQTSSGEQKVTLFSVVEDAEFYISTAAQPKIITENTIWKNDKAKVIFGNLTLAEGKTLSIEKGTRVYFHKNSGLKILKNSKLIANGDLENPVIFRGDRNDLRYDTLPANWNGIDALEGAEIQMDYAKLMGGIVGLRLEKADAYLKNTIIHTFQTYGIQGINARLQAENLIMNNAGSASIGIFGGGDYQLIHSTLANYWSLSGATADVLYASDTYEGTSGELNLVLQNTLLYSPRSNALVLDAENDLNLNYLIQNCLLNYDSSYAKFSFDNNPKIIASIQNEDPKFIHPYIEKMNLRVSEDSPAKGKGNTTIAQQVPKDFTNTDRTHSPTIGAYQ